VALRETPLAALHEGAGARMVGFAGWRLPLQFSSVAEEARATRRAAALFDISHMGNLRLRGPDALAAGRYLLTRNVPSIPAGCAAYALLCNDAGGIVDDLFVMVISASSVGLVVNAVNHDKDVAWLNGHLPTSMQVELDDLRGQGFAIALQGPHSEEILAEAAGGRRLPFLFATFSEMRVAGAEVLVSRTGYTGEDGFELFGQASEGPLVWQGLMEAGRGRGLVPAGLGARDVLRQEMGYPLWGQDMEEQTSPLEAGLERAVDWEGEFIGRSALQGGRPERRRSGFRMLEARVARRGAAIFSAGKRMGTVTSGTYSHNLGAAIGQGYVAPSAGVAAGGEVQIEVRGRPTRARIERFPFLPQRTRTGWAHARKACAEGRPVTQPEGSKDEHPG